MTFPPLQLAAVTSHPRHAFVTQLTVALNDLGSVLDSHAFSNLALAVHFELSPRAVPRVKGTLLALPMALSDASLERLDRLVAMPDSDLTETLSGSLQVTFAHPEPDLRMVIPAVPG